MPLCVCLYIVYVCACMKFDGFVPSLSQGVHTETVFELVCLNQFSELVSRNSSRSHCLCGTGLGYTQSHTHQSSTEMMDPFLVVWVKMTLLHHAKNCHFISVSIYRLPQQLPNCFQLSRYSQTVSTHMWFRSKSVCPKLFSVWMRRTGFKPVCNWFGVPVWTPLCIISLGVFDSWLW